MNVPLPYWKREGDCAYYPQDFIERNLDEMRMLPSCVNCGRFWTAGGQIHNWAGIGEPRFGVCPECDEAGYVPEWV